jgi:hypothetical protein
MTKNTASALSPKKRKRAEYTKLEQKCPISFFMAKTNNLNIT